MTFHDWFERKYHEWRGDTRKSMSQFAAYLGVSQATVSAWLNGTRRQPNTPKMAATLAAKLGPEIYDLLGRTRPTDRQDPALTEWTAIFVLASLEKRAHLLETARRVADPEPTKVEPGSPTAES